MAKRKPIWKQLEIEREKQKEYLKGHTPRQRLFTNEFKKGDMVYIIRYEHGWFDGSVIGKIISLSDNLAVVKTDDGFEYPIDHPRDIRNVNS